MSTTATLDVPAMRAGVRPPAHRPASAWRHDVLLVAMIAIADSGPRLVYALDPSLGKFDVAILAARVSGNLVYSVPTAVLLVLAARRLARATLPPWSRLLRAAAATLAIVGGRTVLWLVDPWTPPIALAVDRVLAPASQALLLGYLGLVVAPFVFAYERQRHRRDLAMRRLAALRLAQREAERRVAAARLRTLQNRVDPQVVLELVGAVAQAYRDDPAHAERLLDRLIGFLRLATSRTREASPTLGQELALAAAYVELRAHGGLPTLRVDARHARAAGSAPFVPGLVLSLLDEQLRAPAVDATVRLAAHRRAGRLWLDIELPRPPSASVREQVEAMSADRGGRVASPSGGDRRRLVVELPDDRHD